VRRSILLCRNRLTEVRRSILLCRNRLTEVRRSILLCEQEKPDYLYYVDKVNEGYIDPGADPKQSKYIDSRGLPIAPKSYKDLYTEDAGNAQMSLMGTAVGRDTGKADRDAYTRGKGVCEQRSKYA
jgi:hypothetical protein